MAVDGTWTITYPAMMGEQQATLEASTRGGTLTGKWTGGQGSSDVSGTAEGDAAAWTVTVATPHGDVVLAFEGVVSSDEMTGTVQTAAGRSPFTGKRAQG